MTTIEIVPGSVATQLMKQLFPKSFYVDYFYLLHCSKCQYRVTEICLYFLGKYLTCKYNIELLPNLRKVTSLIILCRHGTKLISWNLGLGYIIRFEAYIGLCVHHILWCVIAFTPRPCDIPVPSPRRFFNCLKDL